MLLFPELHRLVPHRNTFVGLYFHVLIFAFDIAPMEQCFCINPKKINYLGFNVQFICIRLQFINTFAVPTPRMELSYT